MGKYKTTQSTIERRTALAALLRYVFIGGIVFCIDIGSFQVFIRSGLSTPLATSIAYLLGVSTHFTLNKFFNFRNFERSTLRQLRTYLIVVLFCWLITLAIIEIGTHKLGFTPLLAKMIAVTLNIPIGFVCHRFLTFGGGIGAAWDKWQRSSRKG